MPTQAKACHPIGPQAISKERLMQSEQPNIYEQVFACWLSENRIPFQSVEQLKRFTDQQADIKNFDFLIAGDTAFPVLVELKGRTFHGASLAGLKGLDGWVTLEDVEALSYWQSFFQREKPGSRAFFVFVFRLEQIDVETDGQAVYDFENDRFLLLSVPLERYRACMKQRSPKWQTVTVSAEDFRRYAMPVRDVFFDTEK